MTLVDVYEEPEAVLVLYELLGERRPEQSISHQAIPSFEEHCAFVASRPYEVWYLIREGRNFVGSIYLSKQREIGLFIFRKDQGHGYAGKAFEALRKKHPGPMLANVNPQNERSIGFFQSRGFRHIQNTYKL